MRGIGWHHSAETKAKIAKSNLRENRRGGNSGCLGYRHDSETIEKIRISKMGNKATLGRHHSEAAKAKISAARWGGGRFVGYNGYVKIYVSGHPFADMNGYVYEHRLIVEGVIGRYLKRRESVHHINEIKNDNRKCNLVLCENESYHRLLHSKMRTLAQKTQPTQR